MTEAFVIDNAEIKNNKYHEEGIGILVQMAKTGKIDPWNIDIIDVTDKYLAHLFEVKAQNLKATGKTILFASILWDTSNSSVLISVIKPFRISKLILVGIKSIPNKTKPFSIAKLIKTRPN